jgi:hypothetical protein
MYSAWEDLVDALPASDIPPILDGLLLEMLVPKE